MIKLNVFRYEVTTEYEIVGDTIKFKYTSLDDICDLNEELLNHDIAVFIVNGLEFAYNCSDITLYAEDGWALVIDLEEVVNNGCK